MMLLAVRLILGLCPVVPGQIYTYECNAFPIETGWEEVNRYCDPEDWLQMGILHHRVGRGCPQGPNRGQFDYRKTLEPFIGIDEFFAEWRVATNGDRSELDGTAPTAVSIANVFGVVYHFTIAADLVRFIRGQRPRVYYEIDNGPHTFRLELRGAREFTWYIDGKIVDRGVPDGPFPTERSDFNWRSKSWYLESESSWDFIRYGRIPDDASGDYDSDGDRDLFDHYYVQECFSQSGPDAESGPGCRFADFDGDSDTDLRDFAEFQNRFTGGE